MKKIFNKTDLLYNHIDTKINQMISRGDSIDIIIENLQSTHDRFQKKVLISKIVDSRFRYVYTHNEVIKKRISDFEFIKQLVNKYPKYNSLSNHKIFQLIKLKDKISCDKLVIELVVD